MKTFTFFVDVVDHPSKKAEEFHTTQIRREKFLIQADSLREAFAQVDDELARINVYPEVYGTPTIVNSDKHELYTYYIELPATENIKSQWREVIR